ncbi:MAG: sortase [Clostridium sp.]|nr:sortase [Clostridium sp.]
MPGEGYQILAEPILFTIEDGMTQVLHLVMPNDTTAVDIEKTVGASQTLLAGAKLALIRKSDGQAVDEWTSGAEGPHRIYGLSAGAYLIRELEAPPGYRRGDDQEIVVREGNQIQVFQYANYKKSSGGGGGRPDIPREEFISFRKVDMNGAALPGAQFAFFNQDGSIQGISDSDSNGVFRIKKPADGTYTFRETKAPAGYALNSQVFSFTVLGGVVEKGVYEIMDKRLEVPLRKLDGVTGQGILGATLQVKEPDSGNILLKAETDIDGLAVFWPAGPGRYQLEEVSAPDGYVRTDMQLEFTVRPNGTVEGSTNIYNFRTAKKIGRITAYYKAALSGDGELRFKRGGPGLVRTGDDTPLGWIAAGILVCAIGIAASVGAALWRRKGRDGDGKGPKGPGGGSSGGDGPGGGFGGSCRDDPGSVTAGEGEGGPRGDLGGSCGDTPGRLSAGEHEGSPGSGFGGSRVRAAFGKWVLGTNVFSRRFFRIVSGCFLFTALLFLIPPVLPPVMAGERLWLDIRAEAVEETGAEGVGNSDDPRLGNRCPEFAPDKIVNGQVYVRSRVEQKIIAGLPGASCGKIKTILTEPFSDSPKNHIPAAVITEGEGRYGLKSYETIPAQIGDRTAEVKKQITYQGMGAEENAPETARLEVNDPVTGALSSAIMPIMSSRFFNERWVDGLYLRAVAEDCGAGAFLLGNTLVEMCGEELPPDLGPALVESLGLSADSFQITEISWDGPAYEASGTLNRRLAARGRRLVRDCEAIYGGTAALQPLDGQRIQAIYTELEPGRADGTEQEMPPAADAGRLILEYTAVYERPGMREEDHMTKEGVRYGAIQFIPGVLAVLFSTGLIICCAAAVRADCDYRKGQETYEAVRGLANAVSGEREVHRNPVLSAAIQGVRRQKKAGTQGEDSVSLPYILEEPLREMNPEYCFWIYIPDTRINYLVARHRDNQFYLSHRFDGNKGVCGSIFADCGEEPFNGPETLIYGHNMKDGTMFADLKHYMDEDFRAEHRSIYIYDRGAWSSYLVETCDVMGADTLPEWESERVLKRFERQDEGERVLLPASGRAERDPAGGCLMEVKKLTLVTCHGEGRRLVVRAAMCKEEVGV